MRRGVRAVGGRRNAEMPQERGYRRLGAAVIVSAVRDLEKPTRAGGEAVRAGASARAFLTVSNSHLKFGAAWRMSTCTRCCGCMAREGASREAAAMSNLTSSTTSSRSRFLAVPYGCSENRRGEHGEEGWISTVTLEDVLNRAGQMNRAERWTRWTACGTHQPDSLPRTEAGGARRPRYCPRCWTAFSADGVLWNPPCPPHELGV
jgi:hypothetical protein